MRPARARDCTSLTWLPFVCLLLPATTASGQCPDYVSGPRWVGVANVSGSADDIVIRGSYAYAAWGTGFAVFDLSEPTRPALVSSIPTPGRSLSVALSGDYAFVSAGSAGVHVIDIFDPREPVLTGSSTTFGRAAAAIAAAGSHAYVADGWYGVSVLDLSNPAAPALVMNFDTPAYVHGLALSGPDVYVASGEAGLYLFRLASPARPLFVSSVDTPGQARGVAVSGSYAYVADWLAGVQVVDLSDRFHPIIVATVPVSETGYAQEITVAGDFAYVAGLYDLTVLDISNPLAPRVVASSPVSVGCVGIAGRYAYVGGSSLEVFDVSNPVSNQPAENWVDVCYAADIAVDGLYAYVAEAEVGDSECGGGLLIVDVSDSESSRVVGSVDIPRDLSEVAVSGAHAYLVGGRGLTVCDISTPTSPRIVGNLDLGYWTGNVAVSGSLAYVTDYSLGFQVLNVSEPSSPARLGGIESLGRTGDLAILGSHAYVMAGESTLVTIDISNPAAPVVVGRVGVFGSFVLEGAYAYVCGQRDGFAVVDLSNPVAPAVLARIPGHFTDVAVRGSYAYASSEYGVVMIEISTPAAPIIVGWIPGRGPPIAAASSFLFTTSSEGAVVRLLPLPCDPTPVLVSDLAAVPFADGIAVGWRDEGGACQTFDVLRAAETQAETRGWVRLGAGSRKGDGSAWEYIDTAVVPGSTYAYRIEGRLADGGLVHLGPVVAAVPFARAFTLGAVRPFPAREAVRISYSLPYPEVVRLEVYDVRGRRVCVLHEGRDDGGAHEATWNSLDASGSLVGSGLYFVRLSWPDGVRVTRAAILR